MKLFKNSIAFSLIIGAAVAFAGCASEPAPQPDPAPEGDGEQQEPAEEEAQTDSKTFVIATDTTFAPFEFEDENGNFVGIDIELIRAIAEDQGFEIDIQSLGFNAAVQAVQSGIADGAIAGMSITEERMETFDFSEPYFDSGVVMGIASDNEEIKSYDDLKGKNVAIKTGTEGSTFAESIKDQYGFNVTYFDDSNAMYQAVLSKNAVACFEDYPVLGYAITQDLGLKIVTEKEQGSSYGFAVKKGENAELLSMFNEGYNNLKESGKYQEILDKYIQE